MSCDVRVLVMEVLFKQHWRAVICANQHYFNQRVNPFNNNAVFKLIEIQFKETDQERVFRGQHTGSQDP